MVKIYKVSTHGSCGFESLHGSHIQFHSTKPSKLLVKVFQPIFTDAVCPLPSQSN